MAENIFASFDISGQGMSLQRKRLSAVANNIANVNTTKGSDGKVYQRETVVVRDISASSFDNELQEQILLFGTKSTHGQNIDGLSENYNNNIIHSEVVKDNSPPRIVYDPSHPDAREDGYVEYPNINVVTEMVEMISAQRSFEANTQVVESAKSIAKYSLEI